MRYLLRAPDVITCTCKHLLGHILYYRENGILNIIIFNIKIFNIIMFNIIVIILKCLPAVL